ncbi:MAG TPA: nucleotidyltransferase domain-containing protein [Cyclobacteriaceae bacterium]
MKEIILEKLKSIERQFDVRILYACESGSRAWGFASPDSDYDVRFIYVHRTDYYLSIDDQRDVIELPINDVLDINGWELRKALRLFRKSNAPLYEWLQSPIVYALDSTFVEEMKTLMSSNFSSRAGMHHYLSMSKTVFKSELSGEMVKLKKYFYALRPILAAKWIADLESVPPMDFKSLSMLMPERVNILVDELLFIKAKVDESFLIKKNLELNGFIEECMHYCEAEVPLANTNSNSNDVELNKLFKKSIA